MSLFGRTTIYVANAAADTAVVDDDDDVDDVVDDVVVAVVGVVAVVSVLLLLFWCYCATIYVSIWPHDYLRS